jgi:hypothetical protein
MKRVNALVWLTVIGLLSGQVLGFEDSDAGRGGVVTGERHGDEDNEQAHPASELASEALEEAEQEESGTDSDENALEGDSGDESEDSNGGPAGDTE